MKILVLSQYWWPENGVPQRRWTWLSKILVEAGHQVTVIAPPPHYQRKVTVNEWWQRRRNRKSSGSAPAEGPSGEKIIRSGFFPAGQSLTQKVFNQATVAAGALWAIIRKPGYLKTYRPDLIIGTVPALPTAVVTQIAARIMRVPYIIDLRDAWPDLINESQKWNESTGTRSSRERILRKGPFQLLLTITKKGINNALRGADGIIVTAQDLELDLRNRKHFNNSSKPPAFTTIRNVFPAETSFLKIAPQTAQSKHLNVLYAGTLGRAQNLANAVKAVQIARASGVDVSLRFVGAGVAKKALQDLVEESHLDVRFYPRHESDDLANFYDWADTALVHLTDWYPLSKAVPSKTYELMTIGLHISGVVSGEAAEIIRTKEAGDVVPPEDPQSLAQLWVDLAHNRERLTVGDAGRRWVEDHRLVYAPDRLLKIVEEACNN